MCFVLEEKSMKKTIILLFTALSMLGLVGCHDFNEPIALHGGNTLGEDEILIIKRISSDYVIAEEIKASGGVPCIFRRYSDGTYENIAVVDGYTDLIIKNDCVYALMFNRMRKYDLQSDGPYPLNPEIIELFSEDSLLYADHFIAYDDTFLYIEAYQNKIPNPEYKYYKVSWDGSEYSEISQDEIPSQDNV